MKEYNTITSCLCSVFNIVKLTLALFFVFFIVFPFLSETTPCLISVLSHWMFKSELLALALWIKRGQ